MKKQLFLILSMAFAAYSYGQQTITEAPAVKTDYLKKSKKQKTAAWILLGGGAIVSTIGTVIASNNVVDEIGSLFDGTHDAGYATGVSLMGVGIAAMAGSIPLFIASGKNRRKAIAASVSIDIKRNYRAESFTVKSSACPALTLKLSL